MKLRTAHQLKPWHEIGHCHPYFGVHIDLFVVSAFNQSNFQTLSFANV